MTQYASARSSPTLVLLKTLNLVPFGKLREDNSPALSLHEDSLELRWRVDGQELNSLIPRCGLTYNLVRHLAKIAPSRGVTYCSHR